MSQAKRKKQKTVPGIIKNLLLTNKTADDRPVLKSINELVGLLPGMEPKSAFRYFLLRYLPLEIKRLRNNGDQPAGGGN